MCLLRLLSSTSLRPLFLLSVSLLGLMLLERWKPKLPIITGKPRPLCYLKLIVRLCHSLPKPMYTVTGTIKIYTSSTQYLHWMEKPATTVGGVFMFLRCICDYTSIFLFLQCYCHGKVDNPEAKKIDRNTVKLLKTIIVLLSAFRYYNILMKLRCFHTQPVYDFLIFQ